MFATTELKKIRPTIISRCLQINLSSASISTISEQLEQVFSKEKIKYDEKSIHLIAEAAEGSIRDALSISEKVISFCNKNLKENLVRDEGAQTKTRRKISQRFRCRSRGRYIGGD